MTADQIFVRLEDLANLTQVQCVFVKDTLNHRLRFGVPQTMMRLDRYRAIALFSPGQSFGYIRWQANEYGTQDWRIIIARAGRNGLLTRVPGISPAVKVLISIHGSEATRQALKAVDRIERRAKAGLESLPDSYWQRVGTALMLKKPVRDLPKNYRKHGRLHA